jgi:hypothetical protein
MSRASTLPTHCSLLRMMWTLHRESSSEGLRGFFMSALKAKSKPHANSLAELAHVNAALGLMSEDDLSSSVRSAPQLSLPAMDQAPSVYVLSGGGFHGRGRGVASNFMSALARSKVWPQRR